MPREVKGRMCLEKLPAYHTAALTMHGLAGCPAKHQEELAGY